MNIPSPLVDLLIESLNLTHPRFALAYGRESFLLEFYHQFRHLWERGLPGRLGLGHIVLQGEPVDVGPLPELLLWRLGEHGKPDERLAAVSVGVAPDRERVRSNGERLLHFHTVIGYPHAVNIVVGREFDDVPQLEGVTTVWFDTGRWLARVC